MSYRSADRLTWAWSVTPAGMARTIKSCPVATVPVAASMAVDCRPVRTGAPRQTVGPEAVALPGVVPPGAPVAASAPGSG